MPVVLAVDPDTRCSGLALADERRIYAVGVCDTSSLKLSGMAAAVEQGEALVTAIEALTTFDPLPARFVVEAQQVYARGGVNANNLLPLAMVAGAAMAAGRSLTGWVRCPLPREWKGQQPKDVNHRATLNHYGIEFTKDGSRIIPAWPEGVSPNPACSLCEGTGQYESPHNGDYISCRCVDGSGVQVLGEIPDAHMKEVLDACGLALWGARQRT